MKTYFADIIPRIQKFSQKLDNLTLLTNQHWVVVEEISNSKTVYIFLENNELLISRNGLVEKAQWRYIGIDALLIDTKEQSYLFRQGFFDENVIALKIDGKEEYALLVNESKYNGELNTSQNVIAFLNEKYITPQRIVKISGPSMPEPLDARIEADQKIELPPRPIVNIKTKDEAPVQPGTYNVYPAVIWVSVIVIVIIVVLIKVANENEIGSGRNNNSESLGSQNYNNVMANTSDRNDTCPFKLIRCNLYNVYDENDERGCEFIDLGSNGFFHKITILTKPLDFSTYNLTINYKFPNGESYQFITSIKLYADPSYQNTFQLSRGFQKRKLPVGEYVLDIEYNGIRIGHYLYNGIERSENQWRINTLQPMEARWYTVVVQDNITMTRTEGLAYYNLTEVSDLFIDHKAAKINFDKISKVTDGKCIMSIQYPDGMDYRTITLYFKKVYEEN